MDSEPKSPIEIAEAKKAQIIIPEGLDTLDKIGPLSPEVLPEDACLDALVVAAEIGNKQIGEILKYEIDRPTEDISIVPSTFEEMLDTSSGNFAQRLAKAWIKPRSPERTIRLMKALQVDHFQQIPINALKLVKKLAHIERNIQTNYTLGDTSLNSLVDFATNQTTFNEAIHLFQIPINTALLLGGVANGQIDSQVAVNAGALLINTYCVLAQRYSRARLSIVIDKALRRNKKFDPEKYSNTLGIRFPEHKSENQ